jgi:hypothetical protein
VSAEIWKLVVPPEVTADTGTIVSVADTELPDPAEVFWAMATV